MPPRYINALKVVCFDDDDDFNVALEEEYSIIVDTTMTTIDMTETNETPSLTSTTAATAATAATATSETTDTTATTAATAAPAAPATSETTATAETTSTTASKQELKNVAPLKAMLFIDGTWLYYSLYCRNRESDNITANFGMGWQNKYKVDW
jgi:paraquat-inducible protein B